MYPAKLQTHKLCAKGSFAKHGIRIKVSAELEYTGIWNVAPGAKYICLFDVSYAWSRPGPVGKVEARKCCLAQMTSTLESKISPSSPVPSLCLCHVYSAVYCVPMSLSCRPSSSLLWRGQELASIWPLALARGACLCTTGECFIGDVAS